MVEHQLALIEREFDFLKSERAVVGRQKKELEQRAAIHAQRAANDRAKLAAEREEFEQNKEAEGKKCVRLGALHALAVFSRAGGGDGLVGGGDGLATPARAVEPVRVRLPQGAAHVRALVGARIDASVGTPLARVARVPRVARLGRVARSDARLHSTASVFIDGYCSPT